eukprot:s1322_g5.t1
MCAVYAHFRPKFQKMLTEEQMEACDLKFVRGYLDVEMMEKIKIQSPGLSATDFRFLSEFGVAETLLGPQVDLQQANENLQQAELKKAVAKLQKEEKLFKEYKENVDNFQKVGLGIRAELVERQREAQRTSITAMQESKFPVRDLAECNHGTTFYEASIHRYAAEQGLTENKFLKEEKEYVSVFAKSSAWKRQVIPHSKDITVQMNPVRQFVDPRRDFSTAAGNLDLSKPSRRKQWLSGFSLPSAWLQGLLHGLGYDGSTGCCIIDTFGYDHSMAEAVMRLSSNTKLPSMLCVSLVWAEANTREPNGANRKADAVKVANWLTVALKRQLQRLANEGIIAVPGWEPLATYTENRVMPSLNAADFTCTFPNAANELPLRATFLDEMDKKITIPELRDEWAKVIVQHNSAFNAQGSPYVEESGASEGRGESTKRKLDVVDAPTGSKLLKLDHHSKGKAIFDPDGNLWFEAGEKDAELCQHGPPIALIYGNFKIQEAHCSQWSTGSDLDHDEADKLLTDKKDEVMSMAFESDQDVCCFRMASETHGTVCTLREFLLKIEGGEQQQDLSTLEVACHELVAQSRRLSPSEKSAVEKHSAAALSLAKKAAAEKESACRALASKAAAQKEESKARQILRLAGKEESFSDNKLQDKKDDQKLQSMKAGVVTEAAGSAADKPDNEKLQSMNEGLPTQSGGSALDKPEEPGKPNKGTGKPKKGTEEPKKRAAHKTAGTFAGHRQPACPLLAEIFDLKKELYTKTKEELKKMYPGRKMNTTHSGQSPYYMFLRKKMAALPKNPKPTQDDVRKAVKEACAEWKDLVAKEVSSK